jgi:hypothetical protein
VTALPVEAQSQGAAPSVVDVIPPGRGSVRVLRGSALALCCAVLALSGHAVGGGTSSSVLPLVMVAAPLAAAFVVWADRQRSLLEIGAAALASQVAFHAAFELCAASGASHPASWDVRLVAGHVLGAALMSWVLSRGESALWSLYRSLLGVVSVHVVQPTVVGDRTSGAGLTPATPVRCGAGLVLASAHGRRGPPPARAP